MPTFYGVDIENSHTHIPQHPDRTVFGGQSPFSIYYREFRTRAAMRQWLRRLQWEERQFWRPWMSVEKHRHLLARHTLLLQRQNASTEIQPSLFAS